MGKRGPPPTPTASLAKRGSWRSKERAGEPDAIQELPPMPKLGRIAAEVWRTYEPILASMRVLSRSDGLALELLANTYEEWQLAGEKVAELGLLIDTEKGYAANPAVAIRDRAAVRLRGMFQEFGLTPSARARVKAEGKQEKKALNLD